jgi:hypothetical protein
VVGLERVTVRVAAKDYKAAMAIVAEGVETTSASVRPGSSARQKDAPPERRASDTGAEDTSNLEARQQCESCGAEIPTNCRLVSEMRVTQPDRARWKGHSDFSTLRRDDQGMKSIARTRLLDSVHSRYYRERRRPRKVFTRSAFPFENQVPRGYGICGWY